jgi:hypothetical protein
MPSKKKLLYTSDQKQFIESNYQTMTHQAIATELNIKVNTVRRYCYKHKLHKFRKENANPEPKVIIRPKEKQSHIPPPAEYSAGHEATIEKYLKMEL